MSSVTIAIPFYNCAEDLPLAIRSVYAQTYAGWRLLLVDDGSTDGSLDVARSVEDDRVRVLSDGENRGLSYRLNQIAAEVSTSYLARMDGDDVMHPERIEKQVRFLQEHPEVDLVDAAVCSIREGEEPFRLRADAPLDMDPSAVLSHGAVMHASLVGKASWFKANRYDSQYVRAEDRELWARTLGRTRFARIQEPLYFYRETPPGDPVVYLRKYVESMTTSKRIIRKYGPGLVGRSASRRLVAEHVLKEWVWRVFTRLGLQDRLVERRGHALSDDTYRAVSRAIETVRATRVPGLDD